MLSLIVLELAIYSAIDGGFPLLTKSSSQIVEKLDKPTRGTMNHYNYRNRY
jgi:hypothetical protein